jgi:hypothetical protein
MGTRGVSVLHPLTALKPILSSASSVKGASLAAFVSLVDELVGECDSRATPMEGDTVEVRERATSGALGLFGTFEMTKLVVITPLSYFHAHQGSLGDGPMKPGEISKLYRELIRLRDDGPGQSPDSIFDQLRHAHTRHADLRAVDISLRAHALLWWSLLFRHRRVLGRHPAPRAGPPADAHQGGQRDQHPYERQGGPRGRLGPGRVDRLQR